MILFHYYFQLLPVVKKNPVKIRQFSTSSKTMSRLTQDTFRRRLEFQSVEEEVDKEAKFISRLPCKSKKIVTNVDDHHGEFQHIDKKLKMANVNINNNLEASEDPVVLAGALSRDQLLQLVADLSSGDGGRDRLRSLLPRPDLAPLLASLTYHMHNILRSLPAR